MLQNNYKKVGFILCLLLSSQLMAQKPKLVVGVVVDQMCYEYLYRFQNRFSENGLRKIMKEGSNFRNTQYNYVPTFTGPGHASIYTGTTPENHGIVANDWFHRGLNREVNCVEDTSVISVGTTSMEGKCSPHHLFSNTITDQLKLTYSSSKVISLSIKNRSAILPGGHLSDGSYWFDYETGNFITSSYFRKELPKWVNDFNKEKRVEKACKQTWNTLFPIESYTASGPDNSPYEYILGDKKTATFPYDLKSITKSMKPTELFTYTPFANTALTDLAIWALQAENLGKTAGKSDMLCISYSTPDILGHAFGPYSVEIEDLYLRLDLEFEKLLNFLESEYGKDNFVLFITADHAVVPVPQYLSDKKLPGGYFFTDTLINELKKQVKEKFEVDFIALNTNNQIYFDREILAKTGVNLAEAQDFVQGIVREWEHVKKVYTAHELENASSDDGWRDMVKKGYRHQESGDVLYLLESGYLPKSRLKEHTHWGTSHGSAFAYDTHVPLLWYGAHIPAQDVFRRINITDISATLVHILELQKVNTITGEPILELLK